MTTPSPRPDDHRVAHRFRAAADILEGMADGIDGDRLGALVRWALHGRAGADEHDALIRAFAAPHRAAIDEGEWTGDSRAAAQADIRRITLEAERLAVATPDPSGVYVASRASVPARAAMWRDAGAPIISTWIDEAGEGESHDLGELWARIAREVTSATHVVLYVEPTDFPLKGAFVEVGMALAIGRPVVVVAPGVDLECRSLRPLGPWAGHPLVSFSNDIREALAAHGVRP